MNELNIEFDLRNNRSGQIDYQSCLIQAVEQLAREGEWIGVRPEITFIFTDKIERANVEKQRTDELVIFISDCKAKQNEVTNHETVVARGALTYLPTVLYEAIKTHFPGGLIPTAPIN